MRQLQEQHIPINIPISYCVPNDCRFMFDRMMSCKMANALGRGHPYDFIFPGYKILVRKEENVRIK